jgi:hypothetical protein
MWTIPCSPIDWPLVPLRDVSPECRELDVRRAYLERQGNEGVTACRRARRVGVTVLKRAPLRGA